MAGFEPGGASSEAAAWRPENLAHVGYVVPKMYRAVAQWRRGGAELVVQPAIDPIQNVALLRTRHSARDEFK